MLMARLDDPEGLFNLDDSMILFKRLSWPELLYSQ